MALFSAMHVSALAFFSLGYLNLKVLEFFVSVFTILSKPVTKHTHMVCIMLSWKYAFS